MKNLQMFSALLLSTTLVACGGGDPESSSDKPKNLFPDDFVPLSSSSSSSSAPSTIVNETIPFHENFDNAVNTAGFFTADYKALNTDSSVPFYYATGGFLDEFGNQSPTTTSWITGDDNRKLQIGNGRFTLGQTRLEAGTTTADTSIPTWGEFDLSRPYKMSFCVVQVSSPSGSNFEIYVDNNTTGGNNSRYGAGNASRILQVATHVLEPGTRKEVTVPGGSGVQIGTETSFFQFRVSSGGFAVIDDLIVEYEGEPHGIALPACVAETSQPPAAETVPNAPEVNLIAGDSQITATWATVGLNVTYEVFYNTINSAEGATPFSGNPVSATGAQITGLMNDTAYYVFVRGTNSIGAGEFSEGISATPAAPSGNDSNYTWGFNPLAYQAEENFFAAEFTDGGNNNIVVSDDAREVDGLLIFLSNGTALRYRGNDNRWNFNGHSWSGGSSVMVPAVGEDAPELRAYVGIPVDSGRAFTLSLDYQQSSGSGADSGKIVLIGSDNKVLAVKDALSGSDSITFEAGADHTLSHVKIAYSREGAGGGGIHINNVVKTYASAGAWTGEALALAGSADIAPSGSVSVNEETALTLTATGGNLSSSSHQIFFAHQEVAESNFMFTARIASVAGADEGTGNAYRFGIMIMSDTQVVAEYSALAAWADAGFYVTEPNTFVGSRAHMKADGSRSRSDIAPLAVGDYVRIEVYDDGDLKRVKRYYSTDGIEFTQANSTTDFKATSETDSWRVGFYAAPGVNEIAVEFDNISITPVVSE